MSFNPNNSDYSIITNGGLATILSYFDKDYVLDVVRNSLQHIFNVNGQPQPNIVASFEMDINNNLSDFSEINDVRNNTYSTIINELCIFFNLELLELPNDTYTLSYLMYDFFVSNFTSYMIDFLTKYIIRESVNLYNTFNLSECKKSKDSSTMYSKKVFVNQYIAAIFANIEIITKNIVSYDITIDNIITTVYGDTAQSSYLLNILGDKGNFFKSYYCNFILNEEYFPNILTLLKLSIQQNSEISEFVIYKEEISNE